MPPPTLFDLHSIDLDHVVFTREQIYDVLPHRYEFMQLDGIVCFDKEQNVCVGYRDIRSDEWWVKGHIPGRPLFPGVLMIETAAQLASFMSSIIMEHSHFMAFGGIDDTKFRDSITPPARLYIVGVAAEIKPRRTICDLQGFVDDRMIFQTRITGLRLV
jgi:3-hydroxyacyl-[acyl-carrier-protein] dehydratase